MPIISLINPKGGAGKSTVALLVANELCKNGYSVTLIDADPMKHLSDWGKLKEISKNLKLVNDITEDNMIDRVAEANKTSQFVIIDPEGTASLITNDAIIMSDVVIIPMQMSKMDAKTTVGAIKAIRNNEIKKGKKIKYAVLFNRMKASIVPKAQKQLIQRFKENGINVLDSYLYERQAYKDLFDFGGSLDQLPSSVYNLTSAKENILSVTQNILDILKSKSEEKRDVA